MLSHCLRRADSADRTFHLIPLLGLILLLAAPPASADEPDSDEETEPAAPAAVVAPDDDEPPSAHSVGPVTVTATRAERDVLEVPGNVTVIDREEIERSGVRTVPELLRRQTGLYLTASTTNPAGVQVEARGFNNGGALGSSMLVQVDGRRVNEADTSNTDWALMRLDEIESIEIVRGPGSALYGDNAVGGVINIRTRPQEGPPRATIRGSVGRYSTGAGSLKAAGTAGPVTGSLFVDGFTTDAYRHGADFYSVDVKASLQVALGERVLVGASGGRYYDERQFPSYLTQQDIDDYGRRARNPFSEFDGSETDNRFVHGWLEAVLANQVELRIRPYVRWRDDVSTLAYGEGFGTSFGDTKKTSFGLDGQIQVDRRLFGMANRLIVGFDLLRDETDRIDIFEDAGGNPVARTVSDNEKNVYAGFLQNELNLTEKLLLSAGFRFDRAEYEILIRDEARGSATDDPSFDIWSPKAAITYRFLPGLSAYFSYARGFRLPNFDENSPILSYTPGDPPTLPGLDPQESNSYELGVKFRNERVDAFLALYHMDVENEIVLNPFIGFFGANDNFDEVRHRGIETSIAVQILDWLSLHAGYTFADVKITEDDDPNIDGSRMPITPKHRGTLGMFISLPYQLEFAADALFVDERIVSNDFDRLVDKLDWHATLDLLLAWRPTFGEHVDGALTFALRNVNDEEFHDFAVRSTSSTTVGFYPAAQRTWEVGFMLTLRR